MTNFLRYKKLQPRLEKEALKYLEMVGIAEKARLEASELSFGQQKLLEVVRCIATDADIFLLDEPAAGIDVQGQETIYALLQRIQQQEHLTLVLVSHELDVVMRYAAQVLCLNRELLCAGVPREVLSGKLLEHMYGSPISQVAHSHETHHR